MKSITETAIGILNAELADEFAQRDAQISSLQSQVDNLSPQVAALQAQVDSNNSNASAMQSAFDTQLAQAGNMLQAEKDARTADQQAAASVLNALQALFDQYRLDHP